MIKDLWHFKRKSLAEQVLGMFDSGLSHALVFFAPRRMGKTEFLLKDIIPTAHEKDWTVFYFSFLDVQADASSKFSKALNHFIEENSKLAASKKVLKHVKKVSGSIPGGIGASLELKDDEKQLIDLNQLFVKLMKFGKVLLLLDEVQTLAKSDKNESFLASLRTLLDTNKDNLKVIFTGSSREGLRKMFSDSSAPFFHFGQNLPFPEFDRGFTDHLADAFHIVTKRKINHNELWNAFVEFEKVPQLARSLVERIALNPQYSLSEAKEQLLTDLYNDRAFAEIWEKCTNLEKLILQEIADNGSILFSEEKRELFAKRLGIAELPVSSIQSAIRILQRKNIIGRSSERGRYYIDDPNFKSWLLEAILGA